MTTISPLLILVSLDSETPIIVGTLANGSDVSYILDSDSYGKGLYQENVSILARGCLEKLVETLADEIEKIVT